MDLAPEETAQGADPETVRWAEAGTEVKVVIYAILRLHGMNAYYVVHARGQGVSLFPGPERADEEDRNGDRCMRNLVYAVILLLVLWQLRQLGYQALLDQQLLQLAVLVHYPASASGTLK